MTASDFMLFLKSTTATKCTRDRVLAAICGGLNLFLTNLDSRTNGYVIHTTSLDELEQFLTPKAITSFRKLDLTPVKPKELDARLTVLVRKVPDFVVEHSPDELLNELTRISPELKLTEVVKIPDKTKFFKLRCRNSTTVEKILKEGLKAFHVRIPPQHINQLTPTEITICYNCYKLDDHFTSSCPTKTIKICSTCTLIGHRHTSCPTPNANSCVNCKNNNLDFDGHHTLALRCPLRKTAIKNKQKQQLPKQTNSTDSPLPVTAAKTLTEQVKTALPTQTLRKMAVVIVEAHVFTNNNPDEDYETYLNDSLQENFGLTIKLPKRQRKTRVTQNIPLNSPLIPLNSPDSNITMTSPAKTDCQPTETQPSPPPTVPQPTMTPLTVTPEERGQIVLQAYKRTHKFMKDYIDGGQTNDHLLGLFHAALDEQNELTKRGLRWLDYDTNQQIDKLYKEMSLLHGKLT